MVIGRELPPTANALPDWETQRVWGMWLAEELRELRLEGLQSGERL